MIEIISKTIQIDSASTNVAIFNGQNNIINWTAHSKFNRNIVYNTANLAGNYVSHSLNVIDDRDHSDFTGSSRKKAKQLQHKWKGENRF